MNFDLDLREFDAYPYRRPVIVGLGTYVSRLPVPSSRNITITSQTNNFLNPPVTTIFVDSVMSYIVGNEVNAPLVYKADGTSYNISSLITVGDTYTLKEYGSLLDSYQPVPLKGNGSLFVRFDSLQYNPTLDYFLLSGQVNIESRKSLVYKKLPESDLIYVNKHMSGFTVKSLTIGGVEYFTQRVDTSLGTSVIGTEFSSVAF